MHYEYFQTNPFDSPINRNNNLYKAYPNFPYQPRHPQYIQQQAQHYTLPPLTSHPFIAPFITVEGKFDYDKAIGTLDRTISVFKQLSPFINIISKNL